MPSALNTKTVIINLALSHIRISNFISSPQDTNEQAILGNLWYDQDRRKVLRECDWTFCRKNVQLTSLGDINTATTNPSVQADQDILPGWIWTFAQPPKCAAIRKIYAPTYGDWPDVVVDPFRDLSLPVKFLRKAEYQLGRSPVTDQEAVGCNLEAAWAVYTFDETDESRFDDLFVKALSLQLAVDMCMPLTANEGLMGQVEQRYEKAMDEARRINHQEEVESAPNADDSNYLRARNG